MAEVLKKCQRKGCGKDYSEAGNEAGACSFHNGKPIFHDLKKGWTCCNKIVYDWDEFNALEGCCTGVHTDIKDEDGDEFYKSSTVSTAERGLKKAQVLKTADDFNKEEEAKKKAQEEKPKTLVITKNGLNKCANAGCNKEFDPEKNEEGGCKYHAGQPIFHDLKKYWTCCEKVAYEWDEFMQLPTCCVGTHTPKYK
eukprot:CAMPEP_0115008134 /NCGR_PEP_ID=MMETSP0216-20121206/21697_1 /TAXON_ID=223996 /ORGANISM="Protocruzia adherens, Strain Boccale" /LENGTH=195 /DNA_ID=CAMNT_0002375415 /DNA_START=43 /DNA_END=630 /DNA_ORIENTATION=+